MRFLRNPWRGTGLDDPDMRVVPYPSTRSDAVATLLDRCPRAAITPLVDATNLAARLGLGEIRIKDERNRMGAGSFKALGAAYVIACDHEAGAAGGRTYVTASAGNHGISVAAGAAVFGAKAQIHLCDTVPETFAKRLAGYGAEVVRSGRTYEESMEAAAKAAEAEGAVLLSDSSWPGYLDRPHRLMEGYTVLVAEVFEQMPEPATHVFLQAGVGGLAGAAAAMVREVWGDAPRIVIVEPELAPALIGSIEVGRPVVTSGAISAMGRLDCKEPSLIALKGLARDADIFMTITEAEGFTGDRLAREADLASTPSGAAGLAGLAAAMQEPDPFSLGPDARVLLILSEEAGA
jgi:diaminopropionate ammonia-lyase